MLTASTKIARCPTASGARTSQSELMAGCPEAWLLIGLSRCAILGRGQQLLIGWGLAQRLLDRFHQSVGAEWFVQHGLKTLPACLDDRVRRIPAEPGHQDDRNAGLNFPKPFVRFEPIEIGKTDIDERRRIGRLA